MSLFNIVVKFRASNGVKPSEDTIRCYLHRSEIYSFVAAFNSYLSLKHMYARLS